MMRYYGSGWVPCDMDEDTPIEQDPLIGTTIEGRYKILECLGEGGMGAVYVAEHLTLHKQIALKVIHPEFAGQEAAAERFKREAMVTSRFQHPHVISAIDFGTMPDGGAFLAMELVRGRSLTEILEAEGCLPWGRACMLMSQLADALAAAKDHGIVHRDIKPDNILIARRQDGTETVKVLDFGIARFSRESLTPPNMTVGAQVTREGMIIGTPGYMSPEQSIGEPADHRSDLYALGVILWECIVGKQLWDADSLKELIRAQLATDPPSVRASADDLTLPDELEGLVTSLLKREARDRPDDAAEVRDLLRILSNMGRGSGSFSLPEAPLVERLAAMAEARPELRRTRLCETATIELVEEAATARLHGVALRGDRVSAEIVAALEMKGIKTFAWTVNDPGELRRLVALRVSGIVTDFPERLLAVLGSREGRGGT